jgi:hypothetical protein
MQNTDTGIATDMVMVTVMGTAATAMRRSTSVAPSPSAPD